MVVQKLSVSISHELSRGLRGLAASRGEDLSPMIETLLREHWLVAQSIQRLRSAPNPKLEADTGTDTMRLMMLGRAIDQLWATRLREGRLEEP